MDKKLFLLLILSALGQVSIAKEIPVNIKPVSKITTSNVNLQEGDQVNFVITDDVFINSKLYLKKNESVSGIITSLEENDYLYKPANLYIDNFVTKDADEKTIKLKGIVYKKGNDHWMITQFIPFPCAVLRGGEVQIKPKNKKDVFTLILEDNK